MSASTGKLSIVGTPIGNMEDITLRALRTLREADLIAAEDTRHTGLLLARHGIRKPLTSLHEFNEAKRTPEILRHLEAGQHVALVSDAGMPTLSDPGLRLIRAVLERCSGASAKRRAPVAVEAPALDTSAATTENPITVEVIPGPSAVTAALAASGLAGPRARRSLSGSEGGFLFFGFLPHKSSQRRKVLAALDSLPYTLVFFESPYRLLKSLADMREVLGNRNAVVARELTKKFEEFLRGDLDSLLKRLENRTIKGEITLLVEGRSE